MKKILYGILILLVLVAVGIGVASQVIPKEAYVARIQSAVKDATGRDLTISGDISLGFWPALSLDVSDVAFANAPGASAPAMATLDRLAFELDMAKLLTGAIAVDTFVLIRPVINLEVDAGGTPNWAIGSDAGPAASADSADRADADHADTGGSPLDDLDISLGDVRLVDATITYTDHAAGTSERIDAVTMELSLPSLDDPFGAIGSLTWNDEQVAIDLGTGPLRALAAGETSPVTADIKADPVALSFDGSVSVAGEPAADGTLDLSVPSIRGLAAWAGNPLPEDAGGSGLGPLSISGTVGVDGKKYAFTDARIAIDAIKSTGSLVADLTGAQPAVVATLDVETLDLNPYLSGSDSDSDTPAPAAAPAPDSGKAAPQDWSDAPIDLSGLRQANASLDLTVAGIRVQDIKIGKGALGVTLQDGLFTAVLKQLALYDGMITGDVTVDARAATPVLSKTVTLSGVQALPLLTDAAGFDRLEGRGDASISVTASGNSQKQMIRNLNGNGDFGFRDGAIIGINIGAMVRNVATAFLDASATERAKTDFAELTGTVDIKNGVLTNTDLSLLAPVLRVSGAGSTDINTRTVNYRVEPKLVGSLSGQGGAADASGVAVPIIVTGPWHALSYEPDLLGAVNLDEAGRLLEGAGRAVIDGAVGDVEGAVEGLATDAVGTVTKDLDDAVGGAVDEAVGGAVGGAVQDILGGGASSGTAAPAASGIGGAVEGLLGGGAPQPAPEPQPAQQQPAPQQSEPKQILEDTGKTLRGLFN